MKIIYSKDNPKDWVKSKEYDRGVGGGDGKPFQVSNRLRSSNPTGPTLIEIEMTPVTRVINKSKPLQQTKNQENINQLKNTAKIPLLNCYVIPNLEIS